MIITRTANMYTVVVPRGEMALRSNEERDALAAWALEHAPSVEEICVALDPIDERGLKLRKVWAATFEDYQDALAFGLRWGDG